MFNGHIIYQQKENMPPISIQGVGTKMAHVIWLNTPPLFTPNFSSFGSPSYMPIGQWDFFCQVHTISVSLE